jgi:hypothetical protein
VSHLASAVLRRYVDEPDALLSFEKEHLLQCPGCRSRLELYRERAAHAAGLLQSSGEIDVQAAHRVVIARAHTRGASEPGRTPPQASARVGTPRLLQWGGAVAAGLLLFVAIGYTPVRGYAESFLAIFEPNQFQAIAVSANDLTKIRALPELTAFGTMHQFPAKLTYTAFADGAGAARFARQPILHPGFLPPGVPTTPHYRVSGKQTVSFTFNAAKARVTAAKKGASPPKMPPEIDGSTLSATFGPVIVEMYGTLPQPARHKDAVAGRLPNNILVITQGPAPHIYSSRATVTQIESYLLAQPGLPPGLVAQIHAIGDPATTLPVPVRIDKQTSQSVTVNGAPGLLIGDNTGVGSGVIWQQGGTIHCVAGPYTASQILQVANSMTP